MMAKFLDLISAMAHLFVLRVVIINFRSWNALTILPFFLEFSGKESVHLYRIQCSMRLKWGEEMREEIRPDT